MPNCMTVCLLQALFICLLLPFLSKLWGIPFGQLPNYLKDGAACFLNVGTLSRGKQLYFLSHIVVSDRRRYLKIVFCYQMCYSLELNLTEPKSQFSFIYFSILVFIIFAAVIKCEILKMEYTIQNLELWQHACTLQMLWSLWENGERE